MFFIKDGKLVFDHRGTVPSQNDPHDALTEEQIEEFHTMFEEGMNAIL